MTDDPEATLKEWKASMQAEHEQAIENPDPDADHRIEGVTQVSYGVTFDYDAEAGALERADCEQVGERPDPELLSCACGVREMTPDTAGCKSVENSDTSGYRLSPRSYSRQCEEARTHIRAARD